MSLTVPKVILLLFAASTIYTLWIVPYQSGLLTPLLNISQPGSVMPGPTSAPVRLHYTGVKLLDKQLATMIAFFWPGIDASRADISLVLLEIMSQVDATWMLLVIESLRVGNEGKWYITSITITGLLMQNLGYAMIGPLWMCLHLAYSPSANPSTISASNLASNNPLPLVTLPLSTVISIMIPNILMALPVPSRLSPDYDTKQLYGAIVQVWPVLLGASQLILPILISAVTANPQALSEHEKKTKSIKWLRRCYAFALFKTTVAHFVAVGVPLLAHLFPALFSPAFLPQLQLANVFIPTSPLPPIQAIASIEDGILYFLQLDLVSGSLPVLVWAIALRVQAQEGTFWAYEWVEGLVKVTALTALSGPVGAAVAVMWERDELVFGRDLGGRGDAVASKKKEY